MDSIRATPYEYELLGLLADKLKKAQDYATSAYGEFGVDVSPALNLLGIPAVQQTMERVAYGEPLTTGKGMTTQVRPEVMEAAMTLLPVAGKTAQVAERGAMAAGRAGERLAERVVPQIMERGGMPAGLLQDLAQGSKSHIFVPANPDDAMKASRMLKNKVSEKQIWNDLGVVLGPDKEWRKEISDLSATMSEEKLPTTYIEGYGDVPSWKLGQSLLHPELYKEVPDLQNIQSSFRSGGSAYATYQPGMDWISYNKDLFQKGFIPKEQQEKLLAAKKAREDYLKSKEVVEYDKLLDETMDRTNDFASLEPLINKDIENKRKLLSDNYYGELQRIQKDQSSGSTLGSGQSAKGTTLHEVQHAVQDRFGFAVGGTPEDFKDQAKAINARDALGWAKELRRKYAEMPGADSIAVDAALRKEYEQLGIADMIPSREARSDAMQPSILFPDVYKTGDAEKMQSLVELYGLDRRTEPLSPDEVYKNLMGEAEARLVERRMNLTPEQRRQYFPFEEKTTENPYGLDVNPNDLLYFDEKGRFIQRGLLGQ